MNYYRPSWGFRGSLIPPVIKVLLISNIAVFILTYFNPALFDPLLGLVPRAVWTQFKIWQLFTYMFMHGGFLHILFNMFVLWMFGSDLERTWGSREFLKYYLICGVGAGVFNVLFQPNSMVPIIGASGAIYGVLVAFEFFSSMGSTHSGIAHLAHLGGAVIGFVYIKGILQWRSVKFKVSSHFHQQKMEKMAREREREAEMMEEVDRILDKINQVGYDNLTKREKKVLEQASDKLSKK
jgi:membrane associated rhomboid family serine protease